MKQQNYMLYPILIMIRIVHQINTLVCVYSVFKTLIFLPIFLFHWIVKLDIDWNIILS